MLAALAVGTGLTIWQLHRTSPQTQPSVQALIDIGLPDALNPVPDKTIEAEGVMVWDTDAQRILFEQHGFDRHPMASITKIMTAMVAIDNGINWNQEADINLNEYGPGGNLILQPGEEVSMRDLVAASLVGSANNATKAYVRHLGIDTDEFVQRMNRKAIELGLEQTTFTEVTGLKDTNVSTAYEIARMSEIAFNQYPDIAHLTAQSEYTFSILNSNREHTIRNTNKLIADGVIAMTGSKTGYLDEAKYCLAVQGSGDFKNKIVVVLGSPSQDINEAAVLSLLKRVFP